MFSTVLVLWPSNIEHKQDVLQLATRDDVRVDFVSIPRYCDMNDAHTLGLVHISRLQGTETY